MMHALRQVHMYGLIAAPIKVTLHKLCQFLFGASPLLLDPSVGVRHFWSLYISMFEPAYNG